MWGRVVSGCHCARINEELRAELRRHSGAFADMQEDLSVLRAAAKEVLRIGPTKEDRKFSPGWTALERAVADSEHP